MNKHYYIADSTQPRGFVEVTETEFVALIGDETTRPYAGKVYRNEMTIEKVPEELREAVQAVVDAKIARFGEYMEQDVSASELKEVL